ncbi:putative mitochondrial protein AtMg00300 [Bidens hawaiensis]|uniref:putative mitochondrial protein AtMg00300 n=1 Tax=Bidens hawaiensis TaxID=980011 RepID=UPI0040491AEC
MKVNLHEVRYIPNLKRSLLSLGTFEKTWYFVNLREGKARVIRGYMVVLLGTRNENNFYFIYRKVKIGSVYVNLAYDKDHSDAVLWHKRPGHISIQGLVELNKQQVLGKLRSCDIDLCENCVLSKHKRVSFSRGKHPTKGILDYAHSDLWGLAKHDSLGGAMYFLSIIDDYSRRVWLYILKNKSDTLEKFKEWKILVEIQTE